MFWAQYLTGQFILGALLFVIFINDVPADDTVLNKILKFTDDTNIVSKVRSEDEVEFYCICRNRLLSKSQIGKCFFVVLSYAKMPLQQQNLVLKIKYLWRCS